MNQDGDPDPITIIISPLSSLMVDQVTRCREMGLDAAFVGELQTDQFVKDNVINGKYFILFLTPESVVDSNWRMVLSSNVYRDRIKFVVVDECHCVSNW